MRVLLALVLVVSVLVAISQAATLRIAHAAGDASAFTFVVNGEELPPVGQYEVAQAPPLPVGTFIVTVRANAVDLLTFNSSLASNDSSALAVVYGDHGENTTTPLASLIIADLPVPVPGTAGVTYVNAIRGAAEIEITANHAVKHVPFGAAVADALASGELELVVSGAPEKAFSTFLYSDSASVIVLLGEFSALVQPLVVVLGDYPRYAQVRVGNFVDQLGAAAITINGQTFANVTLGAVSPYQQVRSGALHIEVDSATGKYVSNDFSVNVNTSATLAFSGDQAVNQTFLYEDAPEVPSSYITASVRFVNLHRGSQSVSFELVGQETTTIVTTDSLALGKRSDYNRWVTMDHYDVSVVTNGSKNAAGSIDVLPDSAYTVFAYGNYESTAVLDKTFRSHGPLAYVRFVHGAAISLKVDVSINGGLWFEDQKQYTVSAYKEFAWNATDSEVVIAVYKPDNNESLANLTTTLNKYTNYTIAFVGNGQENGSFPEALLIVTDNLFPNASHSKARFFNLIPNADSISANMTNGAPADWSDVAFGSATPYSFMASGKRTLALSSSAANSTQLQSAKLSFDEGLVYTVFSFGTFKDAQILVAQDYPFPPVRPGLTRLELGLIIGGAILFAILLLAIVVFVVRSNREDGYEIIH